MAGAQSAAAAAAGGLLLGVEVDSGHGEAEAETGSKVAGVEIGTGARLVDQPKRGPLLEQHQNIAVDPYRRARARVRQYLLPCTLSEHRSGS